jgi:hypothetical protein
MRNAPLSIVTLAVACMLGLGHAHAAGTSGFRAEQVLSDIDSNIRTQYFDPKVAISAAEKLDAQKSQLETNKDRASFAGAVTQFLYSVTHDRHLRLLAKDNSLPELAASPRAAAELETARNYGIASVGILPGNIGCLTISGFARFTPSVAQRYAWAFDLLDGTYGLIVDVRNSRGGDPATEANLVGYLTTAGLTLDAAIGRAGPLANTITPAHFDGAAYGQSRPVAITVSSKTISAAEALPYDLQALKRAVIFGETTTGAANPARIIPISDGFLLLMPVAHTVNAITRTSWEGKGVQPDRRADAGRAVEMARVAIIDRLLKNERDETKRSILLAARNT